MGRKSPAAPVPRKNESREILFSVTIKDCDVQTFRSGGKGGQHQNTTDSGARIIHRPSGAIGESREQRSQLQNKQTAFKRMAAHPKFRIWLNREIWIRSGLPSPEEQTEKEMQPENIRTEFKVDGKWQKVNAL